MEYNEILVIHYPTDKENCSIYPMDILLDTFKYIEEVTEKKILFLPDNIGFMKVYKDDLIPQLEEYIKYLKGED